jgi:hypothetical protein
LHPFTAINRMKKTPANLKNLCFIVFNFKFSYPFLKVLKFLKFNFLNRIKVFRNEIEVNPLFRGFLIFYLSNK